MPLSIKITFDLQPDEPLSGFELGHIEISNGIRSWSSQDKTPDQAMMIFPSIVNLLDGLRNILQSESQGKFIWVGVDSSFSISFVRGDRNKMSVFVEDVLAIDADSSQIAEWIYRPINAFLDQHIDLLQPNDPLLSDLQVAVKDFLPVLYNLNPQLPSEQDIKPQKGELP